MMNLIILGLSLLLTATQASNILFGAYPTDTCDSCLDQVFQSCPGDYETRSYATCMCAGDGGTNFISCMSSCDAELNEPANASAAFYRYCVMFFKELCVEAEEHLDSETYNKECSKEAIAAGGIGADEDGEDDDSDKSKSSEASKTAESKSKETDELTRTSGSSKMAEASETTNGATATVIPVWAIMAGLGLQLMKV